VHVGAAEIPNVKIARRMFSYRSMKSREGDYFTGEVAKRRAKT